ncbi:hypothetical protein D7X55_00425 [Corallococcus sp. AB049A]|uniref:Uncharacterized protein n=2 Tax=Myxococcaceae TaxID=31 RepID=A0A3A8QX36_9BACT|nr:hypothetical protein D7Y23_00885 [Corallococcus sp. AB050B]RKH72278.1 hypothetical protein D7X96_05545 [Corallococcus interemptor]RKI75238.1 hypothetical protein D7X55_00425 [Corallococcus sp. AB049A]
MSNAGTPLALRARYFISPEQKARIDSDSYFALGAAHTWNITIGEALTRSFPQMMGTVFQSVQEASSPDDLGDADVLIIPEIQFFDVHAGGFVSELKLTVRSKGGQDTVQMSDLFEGASQKSKGASAWLGGAAAGQEALRQSAEFAFEDVMPKVATRLREVFIKAQQAKANVL